MRLLVTGGAGYVGSVVSAVLVERGHEVTVVDDLSTGHADAVSAGAHFIESSIFEAARLLDASYDGVLHFAARSIVSESVSHPERYWHQNVAGTLALLEAVRTHGVPKFVFSSTAATYGRSATVPIPVDARTCPSSPYGASKLAVEMMVSSYAAAYGTAAVSLRYFNVAGAYGPVRERHDPETHLIPNALSVAQDDDRLLPIFGMDYPTPDGSAIRDYVHVLDLADAHVRALERAVAGRHRIYNVGSGTGHSVLEVVAAVRHATGRPVAIVAHTRRPGDPPILVADESLAVRELGWRATRSLAEMVQDAWLASCGG